MALRRPADHPDEFKLVPNDGKSEKQLKAIHRLIKHDEVETIINACDAGREGGLIFAYVYETSKSKKPVNRLWLNSMTKTAIAGAFERLRNGEEMESLEAAARSRSEADWVVGMNATRAASIRLRAAFDGAVSLGRVGHPRSPSSPAARRRIRNFQAGALLAGRGALRGVGGAPPPGRYMGGKRIAEDEAAKIVEDCGQAGRDHQARERGARAAAAPLRPHLAPAACEHDVRLPGAADARGGAAALRGTVLLPAPTIAPSPTWWRSASGAGEHNAQYERAASTSLRWSGACSARHRRRQEGRGPSRAHPHPAPGDLAG